MCSNAGHVLFRRGPRRRRALWRRAPQWTKTWWAPLPWGQLPMWLAEMVMAPEALQQSGVVVVGVDGVVATGGSRAVVVRAGARAAWSVGGLGACRGCEKTARWGRSDAERGCGQAPPTREGVGERGEGRGARGEGRGRDYFTASLCGRLLVVSKLRACWAGRLRSLVGKSTKVKAQ